MPLFTIQNDTFPLDGQPFRILSGALHYFRIPRPYWDDRLSKARLMGLNTIETYVAWNLHEPRPGEFHFEDQLDVAAFIEAAARHDLKVILRPGPYICSEWDFGGLPSWLLRDPQMRVRCAYPPFLFAVDRFFDALLPLLAPLQITQGGPLLMMQIENEYGSYGDDKAYLTHLCETLRANGIDVLLFTSDGEGGKFLLSGSLDGVYATVNFLSMPERAFASLRAFQPHGPLMCTEFWDGWFDHWGERHHTRAAQETARVYAKMLKMGASVNLYMWHGGTNFGFMNGANVDNGQYLADVTSYDYDAPLSEAGDITPKYLALRQVLSQYTPLSNLPLPEPAPKLNLGPVPITNAVSLWEALPTLSSPIHLPTPEPMEYLDQDYGFILYRTRLRGPQTGHLSILGLHDRGQIFLDGVPLGVLERNKPEKTIRLHVPPSGAQLDILVENMGRVNFGPHLLDRKGILGGVMLDTRFIFDWQAFPLPLANLSGLKFAPVSAPLPAPAFYRATFSVDFLRDTFLALPGWTKGVAWVNGFNLGRYWKIGPQKTLYVPAPLLHAGENELIIFELHELKKLQAIFQDTPQI
ncbi:MAG: beta-galactosidase [Anaerolineales bacterium]